MRFPAELCPACHHEDHDPGSCPECPRCELHFDEAMAWLLRVNPSLTSVGSGSPARDYGAGWRDGREYGKNEAEIAVRLDPERLAAAMAKTGMLRTARAYADLIANAYADLEVAPL